MQLDAILEVGIGLTFVWLVVSVAAMEIQNVLSAMRDWRANHLAKSILGMLKDEDLTARFYAHPLVMEFAPKGMDGKVKTDRRGAMKLPNHIPAAVFARVFCELALNAGSDAPLPDTLSLDGMKASAQSLLQKNPNLGKINQRLLPRMDRAADTVESALEKYRKNVEAWFDGVMAEASAAYKLNAQRWALVIGFVVAAALNIDTIQVAQTLWKEPTLRAALVAQAQKQGEEPQSAAALTKDLQFPIGWTTQTLEITGCSALDMVDWKLTIGTAGQCRMMTGLPAFNDPWGWAAKLFGYFLSAVAAAQGAPFWFDLLRKMLDFKKQTSPAVETGQA